MCIRDSNRTIAPIPEGFTGGQGNFQVYVNGILVAESARTVSQVDLNIQISFDPNLVGYDVEGNDEVLLAGKFN